MLHRLSAFLGVGVKAAYGGDFISEKFDAHRPWVGHHKHIQDAASQRNLSFLSHLCLGLISLFLEPFDEIQRVHLIAYPDAFHACGQHLRFQRSLHQGLNGGHQDGGERCGFRLGISPRKQLAQGIESFGDDIGVRQFVFMGQMLPRRIKQRAPGG